MIALLHLSLRTFFNIASFLWISVEATGPFYAPNYSAIKTWSQLPCGYFCYKRLVPLSIMGSKLRTFLKPLEHESNIELKVFRRNLQFASHYAERR